MVKLPTLPPLLRRKKKNKKKKYRYTPFDPIFRFGAILCVIYALFASFAPDLKEVSEKIAELPGEEDISSPRFWETLISKFIPFPDSVNIDRGPHDAFTFLIVRKEGSGTVALCGQKVAMHYALYDAKEQLLFEAKDTLVLGDVQTEAGAVFSQVLHTQKKGEVRQANVRADWLENQTLLPAMDKKGTAPYVMRISVDALLDANGVGETFLPYEVKKEPKYDVIPSCGYQATVKLTAVTDVAKGTLGKTLTKRFKAAQKGVPEGLWQLAFGSNRTVPMYFGEVRWVYNLNGVAAAQELVRLFGKEAAQDIQAVQVELVAVTPMGAEKVTLEKVEADIAAAKKQEEAERQKRIEARKKALEEKMLKDEAETLKEDTPPNAETLK
jgi:hypothetical protein